MQFFLIHLFLFTNAFACVFAHAWAAYVKELPSTEENPAPYPEDGENASVNVEQILRELSTERAKKPQPDNLRHPGGDGGHEEEHHEERGKDH